MNKPASHPKTNELVGRKLTSVTFIWDYIQFQFDGPCLTAITPPIFRTATGVLSPGSAGWRDGLCSAIGVEVASSRIADEELRIEFANSSTISISLRDEDYTGPEAINYVAEDGSMMAV
jgi:hypothetical protein